MPQHHNYIKVDTVCPECHSDKIWRDNQREETYCNECGLILNDNTIFNILTILTEEQTKNQRVNQFWKKTNSSFMGGNKK